MAKFDGKRELPALKVRQWLSDWDEIKYSSDARRRKPEPHFFIFSIPASELRKLCGIHRRTADLNVDREDNLGIQRQHDKGRSEEISRFVKFGYPWSTISEAKRATDEYDNLRKPGWLSALNNLRYRVLFELVCKSYSLSHIHLSLVPKLPSKASTNLGAIQCNGAC